ncbi:MAG: hypothetical protein A2042_00105 [Candidatus Schekmanbacteria bacterium GWA2_38_11]|uniref:Uncharacterized protein n=1 Tax=Candidatus Schekmanbacteria bacterium GWA2_38_11 TaxID=1817876 RepID=A0A1F7REY3_9BACT|nr:MAG: hypothetical protein A2042_00105 [Candidatus Schekmanbacteria bacterium GWA2_38_11]
MGKKVKEELSSFFNTLVEKFKRRTSAPENLEPELSKFISFKKEYPFFLKKKFFKGDKETQSQVLTLISAINDKSLCFLLREMIEDKFLDIEIKVQAANIMSFIDKNLPEALLLSLRRAASFKEIFCSKKGVLPEDEAQTLAENFFELNRDIWPGILNQIVSEMQEYSLPFVSRLILKDPALDILIVDILAKVIHQKSVELIKEIHDKSGRENANLNNAIKKSFFLLKQRGLGTEGISLKEKVETPVFRPQPLKGEGYVSSLDPEGNQLVIFTHPTPPKGLILFQTVINYDEGIMDFRGLEFTKKSFRSYIAEQLSNKEFPLVEADSQYCKFLLREASDRMQVLKKSPPQEYVDLQKFFDEKKVSFEESLIYQIIKRDEIREKELSESQVKKLLDLPELKGVCIKSERLEKYLNQLNEIETSKIILNKYQKEERVTELLEEAAKEIFDKGLIRIIRRKLEEISYVLYKLGNEEESKLSLTEAMFIEKDLEAQGKNLFLIELMKRSVLRLKKIKEEREKEEPSLIYKL